MSTETPPAGRAPRGPDVPVAPSSRERFQSALECRPLDRPPAWIMRQAGRYLPEYRELRRGRTFLECVHAPELASEITLQPMRRFPLDAAVVFSDILIVLDAMGFEVDFPEGGPRIAPALGERGLDALPSRTPSAERDFDFLERTLVAVRRELGTERALLGFAGAPFTLAAYAVEGGGSKDFARLRTLLHSEPQRFGELLERIAAVVSDLLLMQLEAGADAVQLFDTWAGLLSAADYRQHVLPHVTGIIEEVRRAGGKIILYQKNGSHLLEDALASGADAIGLDWRVDLAEAARRAEGRCALQGNLDPAVLHAPPEVVRERAADMLAAVAGRTGHVANLGHGILPTTPIEGVEAFLAAVSEAGSGAAP